MMTILQALLLGAVQGVTEFWPISSSAHLALLVHFLGSGEPELSFLVALHVGTLAAVTWFYRRRLARIAAACLRELRGKERGNPEARLGWMLLLATIPGLLLGAVFAESSQMLEGMPPVMTFFLALFGIALWVADSRGAERYDLTSMDWRRALAVGTAQALALAPGVSRSGASITVARAAGMRREEAADFAFLLSVPITAAAAAYEGMKLAAGGMAPDQAGTLAVGVVASAVTGYAAISLLLGRVRRGSYVPFAVYRLALAAALCVLLVLGW